MKTSPQLETKPVKELVAAGHALAKELHCAESAALVRNLATALDVQLARANALASQAAKPVLNVQFKNGWPVDGTTGIISGSPSIPDGYHDFYAAPPATVMPEYIPDSVYEILCQACGGGEKACDFAEEIWNACRTAIFESTPPQGKAL
ncbi:hypothetical protein ACJD1C_002710 [Enterobacter kobei]